MNDSQTSPPVIPALSASGTVTPRLGEDPAERVPIPGPGGAVEALLRHPRRVLFQLRQSEPGRLTAILVAIAIACSLLYGVVVGTFSGGDQLWAAPVKIAAGLLLAACICLPSLYIFSCLSGSEARLVEVLGLAAGLLALTTVLLIGFAPVAWVFSQSTRSVAAMGTLHMVFWGVAAWFGLRFLGHGFRQFSARSQAGLRIWSVIFLLVVLQMTTALRPIVGRGPTFLPTEKKFFLDHWLENLRATEPAVRPRV